MSIDTTFLRRCIASLELAVEGIERQEDREDIMYDIYRAASVKLAQGMHGVENAWYRTVSGSQEVRPAAGPGLGLVWQEPLA